MLIGGIFLICWQSASSFPTMMGFGLIYGFTNGTYLALIPSIAAELYGIEKAPSVLGLLMTALMFGSFFGSPIGGALYTIHGNYTITFCFAGVIMIIGAVCIDMMSDATAVLRVGIFELSMETALMPTSNDTVVRLSSMESTRGLMDRNSSILLNGATIISTSSSRLKSTVNDRFTTISRNRSKSKLISFTVSNPQSVSDVFPPSPA
jgi:MFS family permease